MSTGLRFPNRDISFLFTTNGNIEKYHKQFLKKNALTDVLTFADKKSVDIVISLDQAQAQAKPRGLQLFHEVVLLMCHGLLHAKGFDDWNEKTLLKMRRQEFEWIARTF